MKLLSVNAGSQSSFILFMIAFKDVDYWLYWLRQPHSQYISTSAFKRMYRGGEKSLLMRSRLSRSVTAFYRLENDVMKMTPGELHLGVDVHYSACFGLSSRVFLFHVSPCVISWHRRIPARRFVLRVNGSEDGGQSRCLMRHPVLLC